MCWDCYGNKGGDPYKNFTQGAVEETDFEEVIPYRHPPRKKKNKQPKKKGCEGNDYGPHVYTWVPRPDFNEFFTKYYGFTRYESKVCVGCAKRVATRRTKEYEAKAQKEFNKRYKMVVERGEPLSRYSRRGRYVGSGARYMFENNDEEYRAAYRKWLDRFKNWD